MAQLLQRRLRQKPGRLGRISNYIDQCRVIALTESQDVNVPPTPDEVVRLIRYLKAQGVRPLIVGSIAILSYLKNVDPTKGFRPTVDLDLWVDNVPEPLKGWSPDPEAIGVKSWISPSGGTVDFLMPGERFPSGGRSPNSLRVNPETEHGDLPIADWVDLLKLKLNSVREKDLADAIALIRSMGRVPTLKELGSLNGDQRDNLDLVKRWFELRPHGEYGS